MKFIQKVDISQYTILSKLYLLVLMCVFVFSSFADTPSQSARPAAASRREKGQTVFYPTLSEAFEAASGTSMDVPDEIILLADTILETPLIIPAEKHIRLVSDGSRIIARGSSLLEYPIFWIRGNNASLSLGKPDMAGSLVVDGGYVNSPPIEAEAPLAAVSGQYAKFVLYDNVTLQNNCSISSADGTDIYRNGAGVYIRTFEGSIENQAEFIMKGGTIRGNVNNTQNPVPCGGGVFISGFGIFTMEGGVIMDNSAYRVGGGFHSGSRGSFKKTGGIIYGKDAPEGFRNSAIIGTGSPTFYGHALSVALVNGPFAQYRNDTVGEADNVSYIGAPTGNGVFGEGDNWDNPVKKFRKRVIIILPFSVILTAAGFFLLVRTTRRRKAQSADRTGNTGISQLPVELSPREREVFDLLLTDAPIKEISYTLNLTYSGVTFHIKNIYRKLGVHNRAELLVTFSN